MIDSLFSLLALIVTLGVLVTVHEYGHYWVARRLGVKVLRFSVGFGRPIWLRRAGPDATEYVIASIPLGGYVKMLDEREGEVAAEDVGRAFNRQPVGSRIAIVLAGPFANFLFAIVAYAVMFMVGVTGTKPIVGEVAIDSPAASAGFRTGDLITTIDGEETPTWNFVGVGILEQTLDGASEVLVEVDDDEGHNRQLLLALDRVQESTPPSEILSTLGLQPWQPPIPPVIERLRPGGAGDQAGLMPGDRVMSADGHPVEDWQGWATYIRARPQQWIQVEVEREGRLMEIALLPESVESETGSIGMIGAYSRVPEDLEESLTAFVRYPPWTAFLAGAERTWEMSVFTLRMLGRMLVGKASLENLSGPITIAQYAGQSASIGLTPFLAFLGLVSISLGVLNLLPVPVLDGGHLLYYLIELIKGSPLSEAVQAAGQRIGLVILLMLMGLAFFNDISRLATS